MTSDTKGNLSYFRSWNTKIHVTNPTALWISCHVVFNFAHFKLLPELSVSVLTHHVTSTWWNQPIKNLLEHPQKKPLKNTVFQTIEVPTSLMMTKDGRKYLYSGYIKRIGTVFFFLTFYINSCPWDVPVV